MDKRYVKTRPSKAVSRLISYAPFKGRPLTTRGQWINPIVVAHLDLEMRLSQPKKVQKPTFITGMGRSGSTVLGVLLSMHCDVGFLDAPKTLWHAACSTEDVICSYSRGPARYRLEASDVNKEVGRRLHRLYEPPKKSTPIELHPAIERPFEETMSTLGY